MPQTLPNQERWCILSVILLLFFSDCVTLDLDIEVNLTSCIAAVVLVACVDNDLSSSHDISYWRNLLSFARDHDVLNK